MFANAMQQIIDLALLEDLSQGDITTDNLPALNRVQATGLFRARQDCVLSGLEVARQVCLTVDPTLEFETHLRNGEWVAAGTTLASVTGSMSAILKAECVALNFLQHLCGIATQTRRFVDALQGYATRVTHTRKTTPGMRALEQAAILDGGGLPHRVNLGSSVLLKDSHIEALAAVSDEPLLDAVREIRRHLSHTQKIEVEVDTLAQVDQAVQAGVDIILLDNMSPALLIEALKRIDKRAITEVRGCITLENLTNYAATGVDLISVNKLTHGIDMIDIGLDMVSFDE